MKYKLMVSDVDGTLLDQNHRLPEENRIAVELFRKKGGLFTLATGRIEKSATDLQRILSIDLPMILYNGARITNTKSGSLVFEKFLEASQAEKAAEILDNYSISSIFYSNGEGYTSSYTPNIEKHAEMEGITPVLLGSFRELDLSRINKILFAGNNDENDDALFDGFLTRYRAAVKSLPFIVRSNPKYLEILPAGVNKGTSLEVLAAHLGTGLDEVICFGDNLNDLEMIQKAGLGVAMGNSHELLKKEADLVAPSNTEAGVAKIIRTYLL